MSTRPTPLALRFFRLARVSVHVIEGVITTSFVFPHIESEKKQALIRRWSARLLRMLGVEARVHGVELDARGGNLLIVANHVSWLDIFVLHALQPSRFIAKSELRSWPVLGRLMSGVGTLFVERDSRRHMHNINRDAAAVLAGGDVIAIFPEGATTDGRQVLPFHSSLLQPIVDAGGRVQPVALRYRKATGEQNDAPAYVGDVNLMQSFWRIASERTQFVDVHIAPGLPARNRHRRELTRAAESAIRSALDGTAGGSAPGRPGDRPA